MICFAANFQPKLNELHKILQNQQKSSKYAGFLMIFRIFFNLRAILAHQTSYGMFSGSWRIFWHPWQPWGRLSSGDIWVLRFVLNILLQWRRLADFFYFHQNDLPCQLYDLGPSNSDFFIINNLKINNY